MSIKMMRNAVAILPCFVLAPQAGASTVLLDFEGLLNAEKIDNFYNGGTGSEGSSGVNYGISFGEEAQAIVDLDAGGSGDFANEPTANTIAFWQDGSDLLMNVAGGFDTGFSFFYSSSTAATITVYDTIGGTGNILGSIGLSAQSNIDCEGDPTGSMFCNWDPVGVAFAGTARSVSFSGTALQTGYDNITFGSDKPQGSRIPVPAAVWLFGSGLLALVAVTRRKRS